LITRL